MNMLCTLMVVPINFTAVPSWVVSKRSESLTVINQENAVVAVSENTNILQEY